MSRRPLQQQQQYCYSAGYIRAPCTVALGRASGTTTSTGSAYLVAYIDLDAVMSVVKPSFKDYFDISRLYMTGSLVHVLEIHIIE